MEEVDVDVVSEEIAAVIAELESAGVTTTAAHHRDFATYLDLVRHWGKRVNLVSARDLDRLATRHLLESFNLLRQPMPLTGASIVDLGSGAGFPAIPLAIWQEELNVLLVESVRKKAQFLDIVREKLRIESRVTVAWARAEDVGADESHHGRYDIVTARGVGSLTRSVAWAAPFLRHDGHFIAFKGTRVEPELITAMPSMDRCGMSLVDVVPLRWGNGNLVVLKHAGR